MNTAAHYAAKTSNAENRSMYLVIGSHALREVAEQQVSPQPANKARVVCARHITLS
jgi:hypothetical protein